MEPETLRLIEALSQNSLAYVLSGLAGWVIIETGKEIITTIKNLSLWLNEGITNKIYATRSRRTSTEEESDA